MPSLAKRLLLLLLEELEELVLFRLTMPYFDFTVYPMERTFTVSPSPNPFSCHPLARAFAADPTSTFVVHAMPRAFTVE